MFLIIKRNKYSDISMSHIIVPEHEAVARHKTSGRNRF